MCVCVCVCVCKQYRIIQWPSGQVGIIQTLLQWPSAQVGIIQWPSGQVGNTHTHTCTQEVEETGAASRPHCFHINKNPNR